MAAGGHVPMTSSTSALLHHRHWVPSSSSSSSSSSTSSTPCPSFSSKRSYFFSSPPNVFCCRCEYLATETCWCRFFFSCDFQSPFLFFLRWADDATIFIFHGVFFSFLFFCFLLRGPPLNQLGIVGHPRRC